MCSENLILPKNLTGQARQVELAYLADLFWSEHADFANRGGKINYDIMWIIAEKDTNEPHEWHKKHDILSRTKVLGRLALLVL